MPNSTIESLVRDAPRSNRSTGESSCSKLDLMEENISISKKEEASLHCETMERYLETASFWVATTSTVFLSFGFGAASALLTSVFTSSKDNSLSGRIK